MPCVKMGTTFKALIPRSLIQALQKREASRLRDRVAHAIGLHSEDLHAYLAEILESDLIGHLTAARESFLTELADGETVRGSSYGLGGLDPGTGSMLYALVRALQPGIVVETGVCNGFSTAFLLQALDSNDRGELISVDLPEFAGRQVFTDEFWRGKRGAVVPEGKEPGWVIPDHLRARWELVIGRSQDRLPEVLSRKAPIDMFIHDSEHSYECMWGEFSSAFRALSDQGVILADDIGSNSSFMDFARQHSLRALRITRRMGLMLR